MRKRFDRIFWKHSLAWLVAAGLSAHPALNACTLWGAAGQDAQGGGTILAKNRDWKPDHVQTLELRRHGTNFAYFGLYAVGNDAAGLKQGVNEKGLTVVTATASAIPKSLRQEQSGKSGLMTTLLEHYATCDQILADQEKLLSHRKPSFMMISDREKILTLEIGLNGRHAIKVAQTGATAHSNHFLDESLSDCNLHIGESSAARLARISELLGEAPRPLNPAAFAAMSRDQHDGANDSIWRTGSQDATLSSWIIETPRSGPPKLRVVLANPGHPEQTNTFVLDEKFWTDTQFEHYPAKDERAAQTNFPAPSHFRLAGTP